MVAYMFISMVLALISLFITTVVYGAWGIMAGIYVFLCAQCCMTMFVIMHYGKLVSKILRGAID